MNNKEIDQLLSEENEHLKKLHQIVKDSLAEEGLIIQNLLNPPEETLTKEIGRASCRERVCTLV